MSTLIQSSFCLGGLDLKFCMGCWKDYREIPITACIGAQLQIITTPEFPINLLLIYYFHYLLLKLL